MEEQIPIHPRDLLVHVREWLNWHLKMHARYFHDSEQSGHPHGYTGVVIPDWDVRQRIEEISNCLNASATISLGKQQ
jgi:hypothetical protein